ncbi:hypothetical protein [Cytophaga aurantiaca]|uniref:hypothetical protein n=1 Tax=Cytophaga aurantiaca TaxID=29530 RepID=UPI000371571E|nr:hypothetical protein [Cytophaga aurantiaca]
MNGISLYASSSPWFILLCIAIGATYGYTLYSKKQTLWSKRTNYILAALRVVLVSIIVYLLFGPVIRYFENSKEKPTILVHIDNSSSLKLISDSTQRVQWISTIEKITSALESEGIETRVHSFDGKAELNAISFNHASSNLNLLIQEPKQEESGKNIAASILLSDGIYNVGMNPSITPSAAPIYTIGIGDTTDKKDVRLVSAIHNKLAFKGNTFPILAELAQKGYNGIAATVQLKQKGKVLASQKITFSRSETQAPIEFRTSSDVVGIQHYVVEVVPLNEEFTTENNTQHVYIDIVDNKQKVLIVAPSPHPDIKAIQAALSAKENIETTIFIPGIHEYKVDNYSLIIFHHFPDGTATGKKEFDALVASKAPKWFIVSNQTSIPHFNQTNSLMQIAVRSSQKDLIYGDVNSSFDRFVMPAGIQELLGSAPPLQCFFGDYKLKQDGLTILFQRVGRVVTTKPLLSISSNRETMVLAGEGIWQWRLHNQLLQQNTNTFDEFIQKCVQYMSNQNDKRKFRVYPTVNDLQSGEHLYFEAELYNDIMERIYGTDISLQIKNEAGKVFNYSFSTSPGNNRFEIKGLTEGVYHYTASTTLNGKAEKSVGEFIIRKTSLEAQSIKADFNLLKTISNKSNGKFYTINQADALIEELKNKNFKTIIRSKESLNEIINLPWILLLLIALVSGEWVIRKLNGGY